MPETTAPVNVARLKDRVLKILTSPQTEWAAIEAEPTDVQKLYREYIAIMAAIPAICSFIGMSIVGSPFPIVGWVRTPIVGGFANMIVSYVLSLVGVYVAALVIDKLAPTFESTPNLIQALKLVAYASTPVYVAGVLNLVPVLSIFIIIAALYAIYLFYVGLPVLMKTPEAKVVPYMIVSAVVVIALSLIIGVLSAALTGTARGF